MKSIKLVIIVLVSVLSITAQQKYGVFDYPIKPGTPLWKSFKNHVEMERVTTIPDEILKNISTNDLIYSCFNYPLFIDMFAFDDIQIGFDSVKNRFNGLLELFKRREIENNLIEIFKKMQPLDINNIDVLYDKYKFALRFIQIETILSQDEILNKFSEEKLNILEDEIIIKSNIMKDIKGFFCFYHDERNNYLLNKISKLKKDIKNNVNGTNGIRKPAPKDESSLLSKASVINNTVKKVLTDQEFYLETPRGNRVYDSWILDEFSTYAQFLSFQEGDYLYLYNSSEVVTINDASRTYNCHGYAWYPNQHINICHTGGPTPRVEEFWQDGSFNIVDNVIDAERVVYAGGTHSALIESITPLRFISKWHWGRLVTHPPGTTPYGQAYSYYARAHDVGYQKEHQTIEAGLSNAKPSQTVYVFPKNPNDPYDISGDITIGAGQTLSFSSGVSVNLGTHKITGKIIGQEVSWSPCNVKLKSGSIQVGQYSSLETAVGAAVSGQTVVLGSSDTITNTLTIINGVTLQINSGIVLTCTNVTVNVSGVLCNAGGSIIGGTISVSGSANSSGGSFNGTTINVSGSGSISASGTTFQSGTAINLSSSGSCSLSNCLITGASTGISVSNNTTYISGCRIQYCNTGVNCTNYSTPSITAGVFAYNNYDIYGDYNSSPVCGGSLSFRSPSYYQVYSSYWATIYAQGNYWGTCPITPLVTNNVNYSNYICTDPNPRISVKPNSEENRDLIQAKRSIALGMPFESKSEPGKEEMDKAFLLYINGKYSEALDEFDKITDEYPNGIAGNMSIVLIERCLEKSGREKEIYDKIDLISKKYSGKSVSIFAESRKVYQYIRMGKYEDAALKAKEVLQAVTDTTLIKMSLFDLGNLYWNYLGDKEQGGKYYTELINKYPYDNLSTIAKAALVNWKPGSGNNKGLSKTSSLPEDIMIGNYPNPFNPTTNVEFRVPEKGFVTLIVYDILGREISTMVNEVKEPGVYTKTFDAGKLTSGIYFYRFVLNPENGGKEIKIQKSMRVVK